MPLQPPRGDLTPFPAVRLATGESTYRIHRADRSPWWFSSSGAGRFDLTRGGSGTCYLAASPAGAFIEVFRQAPIVAQAEVDVRRIALLFAPSKRLADCTDANARAFGITGAIHSTPDYELTQAWAEAFRVAGFGGVRYLLSHDPAQIELGFAIFGAAGEPAWPIARDDEIVETVIADVRRRFGLIVAPAPD